MSGTRLYSYKHPESPEHATITVLKEDVIAKVKEGDPEHGVLYWLMQAQKAVEFLLKQKLQSPDFW